MSVIRFATGGDKAALKHIWQTVFPEDNTDCIQSFLEHSDLPNECLLLENRRTPVSMVFFLPAVLRHNAQNLPVSYIYAAATMPDFRGRGYFSLLLKEALKAARGRGAVASFLRPAEPSLFAYYTRFGYQSFFYAHEWQGVAAGESRLHTESLTASIYLREQKLLLPETAVLWDEHRMTWAAESGDCLSFCYEGEWGCAFCIKDGDCLYIRELLFPRNDEKVIAQQLACAYGCVRYSCRMPARTQQAASLFGMLLPFGDIKISSRFPPYMGLALD